MAEEKTKVADYFKCPSCGSNMEFDTKTQNLKCCNCGAEKGFEQDRQVSEIAIEEAFKCGEVDPQATICRCENCGAQIVLKTDEFSTECPFCSTSHIIKATELTGVKPNALYPFLISKEEAYEKAKKNIKKRLFCPRKFKKELNMESVKGLYLPCFTFDSNTFSTYVGRLGRTHTRTVSDGRGGSRTETYVEWFFVSGTYSYFFDDITISTSTKLKQKTLNKIMPFNKSTITNYKNEFLSGFFASHYEKDVKTSWSEAKDTMDGAIRRMIVAQYHCDRVDYLNISTMHNDVTYKYVLMPVYMMNFLYRNKDYGMYINGNTGKMTGKMPVSPLRVFIASLIGVAIVAVITFFIVKFGLK